MNPCMIPGKFLHFALSENSFSFQDREDLIKPMPRIFVYHCLLRTPLREDLEREDSMRAASGSLDSL